MTRTALVSQASKNPGGNSSESFQIIEKTFADGRIVTTGSTVLFGKTIGFELWH